MHETKARIIKFLKEEFINYTDFELSGVNLDTRLDEIGIDNMNLIKIGIDLEQEFEIEINTNEADVWSTPNDMVNTVLKELRAIDGK